MRPAPATCHLPALWLRPQLLRGVHGASQGPAGRGACVLRTGNGGYPWVLAGRPGALLSAGAWSPSVCPLLSEQEEQDWAVRVHPIPTPETTDCAPWKGERSARSLPFPCFTRTRGAPPKSRGFPRAAGASPLSSKTMAPPHPPWDRARPRRPPRCTGASLGAPDGLRTPQRRASRVRPAGPAWASAFRALRAVGRRQVDWCAALAAPFHVRFHQAHGGSWASKCGWRRSLSTRSRRKRAQPLAGRSSVLFLLTWRGRGAICSRTQGPGVVQAGPASACDPRGPSGSSPRLGGPWSLVEDARGPPAAAMTCLPDCRVQTPGPTPAPGAWRTAGRGTASGPWPHRRREV